MPTPRERIEDVVGRLARAVAARRLRDGRGIDALQPGPPAVAAQIGALQSHLGLALPPLWREFLQLHDGYAALAAPGSMLSIAELLPGSPVHEKAEAYRKLMLGLGHDALQRAVFFAHHEQPNDWACFYPDRQNAQGEWPVALWMTADDVESGDLAEYLESRIAACARKG